MTYETKTCPRCGSAMEWWMNAYNGQTVGWYQCPTCGKCVGAEKSYATANTVYIGKDNCKTI